MNTGCLEINIHGCCTPLSINFSTIYACHRRTWRHRTTWWRHQIGNILRVIGPLRGEFTGHHIKASDAELWCFFFHLRLNKQLSKQSWGWWFETPSRSLWPNCSLTSPPPWFKMDAISMQFVKTNPWSCDAVRTLVLPCYRLNTAWWEINIHGWFKSLISI